jgi:HTH-type transcriptional regulator / antitoxin HigA
MNQLQYKIAISEIEKLLQQGFSNLDKTELKKLEKWSREVAGFEEMNYAIPKPDTLAEMIELRMYEMRITQKELAARMGVSQAKLSLILNGKQEPDISFLKQCKHVLGISSDFILEHA